MDQTQDSYDIKQNRTVLYFEQINVRVQHKQ